MIQVVVSKQAKKVTTDGALLSQFSVKVFEFPYLLILTVEQLTYAGHGDGVCVEWCGHLHDGGGGVDDQYYDGNHIDLEEELIFFGKGMQIYVF